MIELNGKKVLVTGPNSMVGRCVWDALKDREAKVIPVSHEASDLLSLGRTKAIFHTFKPKYVIHLAGYNGNVAFSQKYPADIYYQTTQIGLNVLKCCQDYNIKKLVSVLSSCAIADKGDYVLQEEDLWEGLPHESIEAHGLAKRNLHAYSRQLKKQYDLDAVCVTLQNSYGPFDSWDENKTKAIAAIIKRFINAKDQGLSSVTCWGTGVAQRSFIYCKDAGEAIVQSLERFEDVETPLNIGTDKEITIKELVSLIADLVGYEGEILWDHSKPDGQLRKFLDNSRMKQILNVKFTPLSAGLVETIKWYRENMT